MCNSERIVTTHVLAACLGGTYSDEEENGAASDCTSVDAGSFAAIGSTEQTACAKGTYTDASIAVKDSCTACPGGKYQDAEGQTACKQCEAGSYCPTGAAAAQPMKLQAIEDFC